MDHESLNERLSHISTLWSVVQRAGESTADDANDARRQVLRRYGDAVYRYLLGALRDRAAADELYQEFAVRLLHGRMRGADPKRGRFRDFVKGVVFHMIADYYRQRGKQPQQMPPDMPEPAAEDTELGAPDRQFNQTWRDELLEQCWHELERIERQSGQPYHSVLRYHVEHPGVPSPRIARHLQTQFAKPFKAASVRQMIRRARKKFSDHLVEEVVHSLENPTADDLEQELIDLDLLELCRPALERWCQKR